jgi:hypothetical protein
MQDDCMEGGGGMAVCRVEKNENYTVMSNYHLSDSRLSLKAVGLLSKMLSLPEDWDYTIRGLTHICREGRDAIKGAIVELEEAGYIQRQQRHDENGKFAGNEYVIHEAPLTDFPLTVKPLTENPPELNTKLTKYLNNTPPIVPPTPSGAEGEKTETEILSAKERERLVATMGADRLEFYLVKMQSFIASEGKSYKNPAATIEKWYREDMEPTRRRERQRDKKPAGSFETDEFFAAAVRKSYSGSAEEASAE